MQYHFAKMCAAGNDFIVIDNRDGKLDSCEAAWIERICSRRMSMGADGLILLDVDDEFEFSMKYFNSDGFEASMCGNGGRCIALFAHLLGISGRSMTFRSRAGIHSATLDRIQGEKAEVTLSMSDPVDVQREVDFALGEETLICGVIDTGVPHVVLKVTGLEAISVEDMGRSIRRHSLFEEQGTNVDFLEVLGENRLRVRTYERGVEGETLSCGTGAVAAAAMASLWTGMPGPVTIETASGEDLTVSFQRRGEDFSQITLRGNARVVYRGVTSEV